jgi:ubiquinone/menaquinone biosynthesis C-methylase UbiE
MTSAPSPNFNHIARIYRWAEYLTLGPLLQKARTHYLADLPTLEMECGKALVLGDGDGRFLARLLAQQTRLQALAIDSSDAMLGLLRRRCRSYSDRLEALHRSALEFFGSCPEDYYVDLIVTHFFLDCLTQPELDRLAGHLAAHTRPGALWLLSDFAIPSNPWLAPLAALYIRFLYLVFRLLTGLRVTHLPDPASALSVAGFHRIARHNLLCGILYTEIWQRGDYATGR